MKNILLKIVAAGAYVAMVGVNAMANVLPLNNRSTGEISNAYPNLFAPAGITFSIWGVIYLLLGGYVVYQFIRQDPKTEGLLKKINPLFIATSIANVCWIFSWHYDFIGISVILMVILLFLLIKIADILGKEKLLSWQRVFIGAPFSIYFGWITIATVANITVFLVSIGWNGFGISDVVWTSLILLIAALIGILRMRKDNSVAYGLVLIWAYLGILLKHLSVDGYNGQYPMVIATAVVCVILYMGVLVKIILKK